MKKTKALFYVLMFLPLALTLIALVVLPDRVPIHYDVAGDADGWGSKYINLIFPVFTVLMALFFIVLHAGYKRNTGEERERVILVAGCGTLAVFNVMTAIFLVQAYLSAVGDSNVTFDFSRILFTVTGMMMIALGNVMPKLRRNGLVGVRTTWSEMNDDNWRKGQVAGGVVFIVVGALLIIGNVFFIPEGQSVFFSIIGMILMLPTLHLVLYLIQQKS